MSAAESPSWSPEPWVANNLSSLFTQLPSLLCCMSGAPTGASGSELVVIRGQSILEEMPLSKFEEERNISKEQLCHRAENEDVSCEKNEARTSNEEKDSICTTSTSASRSLRSVDSEESWWEPVPSNTTAVYEGFADSSRLCSSRVVELPSSSSSSRRWLGTAQSHIYEGMGATDAAGRYIAVWLYWEGAALVTLSEVGPEIGTHSPETGMSSRLQAIADMNIGLPSFLKSQEPQSLASYYGEQNVKFQCLNTANGAIVECLEIDLHSKWLLRMAAKSLPIRAGSTCDFLLLDSKDKHILVGARFAMPGLADLLFKRKQDRQ